LDPRIRHNLERLGFQRPDDYQVLALDDRNYNNGLIVVRPDAVIRHRLTGYVLTVEMKTRPAGRGPTPYELWQTKIQVAVVQEALDSPTEGRLLYGDKRIWYVVPDEAEVDLITKNPRLRDLEFRHNGRWDESRNGPNKLIAGTRLAMLFTQLEGDPGPRRDPHRRAQGREGHRQAFSSFRQHRP